MRRKALLIGALPLPQEGPWVSIADAREWRVDSRDDYCNAVVVEVLTNGGPPSRFPLNSERLIISGNRARAVILDEARERNIRRVTVNIEVQW